MDTLDQKILNLLQEDATLSVAEIGERVGLSTTPCWRRIQNLEKAGIIQGRVTLLDAEKLNVGVTVFVAIRTNQHSLEWLEKFAAAVSGIPEVVEFYRMSGDVDYLLRVVVPDIAGYDAVYKRLISAVDLSDVSSSFAMEKIKSTTALPLNYVKLD
jgi:Lrp/AsnC family transcriptional regulator